MAERLQGWSRYRRFYSSASLVRGTRRRVFVAALPRAKAAKSGGLERSKLSQPTQRSAREIAVPNPINFQPCGVPRILPTNCMKDSGGTEASTKSETFCPVVEAGSPAWFRLFFAVVALSVSVVSFPLLLDRDVNVLVAIQTSVRAVLTNPFTMALWGLIVASILATGFLLLFVGLAVAVPILGHSTWHLYRRVVDHAASV
jgi:hypothetical protein